MSRPRPILPGSTYLVTRRTLRRHHLFRPDAAMRGAITYLLAVSAHRHGVAVHAFCAMSTHVHLVVTDTQGRLPMFLALFHRLLALTTKVVRKWEGAVWDHEQTSVVRLETPEAVVDRIGYVLANPVSAGLVQSCSEWPGAKSDVADLGRGTVRAARPTAYLDAEGGGWPAHAAVELTLPPGVAGADALRWREAVRSSVAEHERAARVRVTERGGKFSGARRVIAGSPFDRATSAEPLRDRNPSFAVGAVVGAYRAAVAALRAFRGAYAIALEAWKRGVRDAVFPPGTWWMAQVHAVRVGT